MALCLLAFFVFCVYSGWKVYTHRASLRVPLLPQISAKKFGALTVADAAFNYERAILDLDEVNEETKERAMRTLSLLILPLVGHVRLDDVTTQFEDGVGAVLRAQVDENSHWVVHVWHDLLRWSRNNLAAA